MSDVTFTSVPSVPAKTIRRARTRRPAPREAGTDLLQLSSRITEDEARVLAQARAILFKLSAQPKRRELNSPSVVREYLTTLLSGQDREYFAMVALTTGTGSSQARSSSPAPSTGHPFTAGGGEVRLAPQRGGCDFCACPSERRARAQPGGRAHYTASETVLALIDVRVLDHFIVGDGRAPRSLSAGYSDRR